jgi:hypothetical protein
VRTLILDRVDHRAARQQLAVFVATVDTRDASPDANGIVHDLLETIMPDRGSECPADREAAWQRRCQRRQQRGGTAAYGGDAADHRRCCRAPKSALPYSSTMTISPSNSAERAERGPPVSVQERRARDREGFD